MSNWIEYQPQREREKEHYDIMTRDGTVFECCYPNGTHWYPQHPFRAQGNHIADYRVIKIRRCEHPMDILRPNDLATVESIDPELMLMCEDLARLGEEIQGIKNDYPHENEN